MYSARSLYFMFFQPSTNPVLENSPIVGAFKASHIARTAGSSRSNPKACTYAIVPFKYMVSCGSVLSTHIRALAFISTQHHRILEEHTPVPIKNFVYAGYTNTSRGRGSRATNIVGEVSTRAPYMEGHCVSEWWLAPTNYILWDRKKIGNHEKKKKRKKGRLEKIGEKLNSNEWTEAWTGAAEQRVSVGKYCLWDAAIKVGWTRFGDIFDRLINSSRFGPLDRSACMGYKGPVDWRRVKVCNMIWLVGPAKAAVWQQTAVQVERWRPAGSNSCTKKGLKRRGFKKNK